MTDNPIYRAALEKAAVVPALVAPGHWLVSDVDRIHDALLALPAPDLRETLARMSEVQALVAEAVAKERERCAKECDRIAGSTKDFIHYTRRAAGMCAAAIRSGKGECG